jgi:hypothetical protein
MGATSSSKSSNIKQTTTLINIGDGVEQVSGRTTDAHTNASSLKPIQFACYTYGMI